MPAQQYYHASHSLLQRLTTTPVPPLEIPSQQTLSLPPRCPTTTLVFTSRDAYIVRRATGPRCQCLWSIASLSSSPPPPPVVAAAAAVTRTRARASRRWSLGAADPCPVCYMGTILTITACIYLSPLTIKHLPHVNLFSTLFYRIPFYILTGTAVTARASTRCSTTRRRLCWTAASSSPSRTYAGAEKWAEHGTCHPPHSHITHPIHTT